MATVGVKGLIASSTSRPIASALISTGHVLLRLAPVIFHRLQPNLIGKYNVCLNGSGDTTRVHRESFSVRFLTPAIYALSKTVRDRGITFKFKTAIFSLGKVTDENSQNFFQTF